MFFFSIFKVNYNSTIYLDGTNVETTYSLKEDLIQVKRNKY